MWQVTKNICLTYWLLILIKYVPSSPDVQLTIPTIDQAYSVHASWVIACLNLWDHNVSYPPYLYRICYGGNIELQSSLSRIVSAHVSIYKRSFSWNVALYVDSCRLNITYRRAIHRDSCELFFLNFPHFYVIPEKNNFSVHSYILNYVLAIYLRWVISDYSYAIIQYTQASGLLRYLFS